MSYIVEQETGDIVISGFENGIGDSPYTVLSDMKSVNPSTIPGEASVSFSTKNTVRAPIVTNQSGTVSTGTNLFNALQSLGLETGQWIVFNTITTGGTGLSTNTPYYLVYDSSSPPNQSYSLIAATAAYPPTGGAVVIGANSNVTFSTVNMGLPKYFAKSRGFNWMIDANGRVWSDISLTSGGGSVTATNSWTYTGNPTDATSNGNGLLCYETVTNGTGGTGTSIQVDEWIFVWRNSQIDYTKITAAGAAISPLITWVNGWKPSTGTTAQTQYLQTRFNVNNSHQAVVTPDARVNYCDGNYIGNFYQNVPTPGSNYVGFDPTNSATYTFSNITAIMPAQEVAQCIAFLNQYLLIGGKGNIVYPWDLNPGNNTYSPPLILLPETNIQAIVPVGNNAYIFAGNRGIIYITNGSQANFYKKVPDHISGTVEPLFSWGGSSVAAAPTGVATYSKNRLFFGCYATPQAGGVTTTYGGLWCIDLSTGSLFNAQQMSYGSYSGYVSAVGLTSAESSYGPNIGYGLMVGWSDAGTPTYGVDVDIATPYSSGQSFIVSDMIPIGTLLNPTTSHQVEFKLATPMVSGESVQLLVGSYLNDTFTSLGTASGSSSENVLSGNFPLTVQKQQWAVIKAILTSN
jgi:hypothetical protein